jgi:hypothetical protein
VAATLTGTPVGWVSGSVTIPADATAVYLGWSYFKASSAGAGLLSATLNSVSGTPLVEAAIGAGATDASACGCVAWYSPATGSQTLSVTWDATPPDEGPVCIVAFVKGGSTTPTDAKATNNIGTNAASVTLTTVVGDLVLMMDQAYGAAPADPGGSWTSPTSVNNNFEYAKLSYLTAAGTSEVCASQATLNYSNVWAISIPAASGGGPTYTLMGQACL